MPTPSRSQQSILIDAVFYNRDKQLMEAFRDRLDKLERRQQLKHVSDIRDEALLDRLLGLGITAECLAALGLVPLVWVAWADGEVAVEERDRIVAMAQAAGRLRSPGRGAGYPKPAILKSRLSLPEHFLCRPSPLQPRNPRASLPRWGSILGPLAMSTLRSTWPRAEFATVICRCSTTTGA